MTQPTFRIVRRGYEPGDVDQAMISLKSDLQRFQTECSRLQDENAALNVDVTKSRQHIEQLKAEIAHLEETLSEERAERSKSVPPTFANLGERIGAMLTLAQEEADELRRTAKEEACKIDSESQAKAQARLDDARREAEDTVLDAKANAEKRLEDARRKAAEILEDADSHATTRKEEAEAIYEAQRAQAAQAAADFENTLASRREQAMAELNDELDKLKAQVQLANEELLSNKNEAAETVRNAKNEAEAIVKAAQDQAESLLGEAKGRAETIRQNSERELAAATARRDSITAQLANVRQMLATLSGGQASPDPLLPPTAADWAAGAPLDDIDEGSVNAEDASESAEDRPSDR